jgi:hypothetical protein
VSEHRDTIEPADLFVITHPTWYLSAKFAVYAKRFWTRLQTFIIIIGNPTTRLWMVFRKLFCRGVTSALPCGKTAASDVETHGKTTWRLGALWNAISSENMIVNTNY